MSFGNKPHPRQTFGFLLADVTRLMRKQFDRRAAESGMTRAQWKALKHIASEPGLRQSDLAELIDLEPIAVGRVVDRLEKAGFVERKNDPKDRRCWRLHVTDGSADAIAEVDRVAEALRRDILRGISLAEQAVLVDLLSRMKANLAALDSPAKANP